MFKLRVYYLVLWRLLLAPAGFAGGQCYTCLGRPLYDSGVFNHLRMATRGKTGRSCGVKRYPIGRAICPPFDPGERASTFTSGSAIQEPRQETACRAIGVLSSLLTGVRS